MLWLSCDPGETTGWALWEGEECIDGGQTPMWEFIDDLSRGIVGHSTTKSGTTITNFNGPFDGVELIVAEEWAIYPWKMRSLEWDKCRTARCIGAIELLCRLSGVKLVLQPAKIKERAEAAGAEALFATPLNENRHENDAKMHGVFFLAQGEGAGE